MSNRVRPWYWPAKGQPERTEPFTWIIQDVIAASWWPDPYVFDIYKDENVKAVVNCCEFDNRKDVPKQFDYYHIHVPDYGVPTDDQLNRFIEIMDKHHAAGESVVIHCVAGCGRTGQFIVAWCSKAGLIPNNLNPVEWIRSKRRCCLETGAQEQCAKRLYKKYHS
ncbi:protein-tyrosine phosphatase family protein [Rubritalea marina]|uniref:protein-tyrosine phosphatase family protein n=1 Tax=Rubritalea marina TaxID=361055 RepID=UPI000370B9A6|nr:dual specificity protein phosphatase family protein [Rubritalea marina]